ncbi:MAG: hypothetical protein MHM6MM_007035 [Cercozoa sp. M6MM]
MCASFSEASGLLEGLSAWATQLGQEQLHYSNEWDQFSQTHSMHSNAWQQQTWDWHTQAQAKFHGQPIEMQPIEMQPMWTWQHAQAPPPQANSGVADVRSPARLFTDEEIAALPTLCSMASARNPTTAN